jgi:hypothetical protein
MPKSVVGMDVTFAAVPRARGWVVPMIEFQLEVQGLTRRQLDSLLQRPIL